MDTKQLIVEEIRAEQIRREDAFRLQIRDKIRGIASYQAEIARFQKAVEDLKNELAQCPSSH